ncbi:hypothetical protein HID58_001292 [Brassica napus]|uniref:Peptidylprolyl isomerase n=1 Tax=Brassica napus TaxID=3708 RepID=A0ABQ8EJ80_BRANA|nr:hypothetical protein HID58_001292 [Brassica napus]
MLCGLPHLLRESLVVGSDSIKAKRGLLMVIQVPLRLGFGVAPTATSMPLEEVDAKLEIVMVSLSADLMDEHQIHWQNMLLNNMQTKISSIFR